MTSHDLSLSDKYQRKHNFGEGISHDLVRAQGHERGKAIEHEIVHKLSSDFTLDFGS